MAKPCKDCVAECAEKYDVAKDGHGGLCVATVPARPVPSRAAPHPGPRCATHWRAEKKRRSAASHESRVTDVYGLLPGDYERLYAAQGGRCAIHGCRARGISRRLSVDHDHKLEGRASVRGLLCSDHNSWIGRAADDPEVFLALAEYLKNPPAVKVLTP